MKKFIPTLLTLILLSCGTTQNTPPLPSFTLAAPTTTVPATLSTTTAECTREAHPPLLTRVDPSPVPAGGKFKLTGSGGYLYDSCLGFDESARSFDVHLDGRPLGSITCYVNHCEGSFTLPSEIGTGGHCLSIEPEACDLQIQVEGR